MEKKDGRFKKGERRSPKTEFKPGEHWRPAKPFREKEWLEQEYVVKKRSAGEIAAEFGVTDAAILFWIRKHGIPRRTVAQARSIKHWGLAGEKNGMYGVRGDKHPGWRGGITPERQTVYSSKEWAKASVAVWRRDKRTCQRCGKRYSKGMAFHIHHIVSFQVVALRTEPSNLVLLCIDCHHFVHSPANVERLFIKEGGQTL